MRNDTLHFQADFGWSFFGPNYADMSDQEVGLDVLDRFVNKYNDVNGTSVTVEEVKSFYPLSQITGLGLGVKFVPEIDSSVVDDAMENIIQQSGNNIPNNLQVFLNALSQQVQGQNPIFNSGFWKSYGKDVVVKLAEKGTQAETLLTAGTGVASYASKNINWVLPIILGTIALGIGAYFIKSIPKIPKRK